MTTVWIKPFDKAMDLMAGFFGISKDKAKDRNKKDYEDHKVKNTFGLSLAEWSTHVSEYWLRKSSWDSRFKRKEVVQLELIPREPADKKSDSSAKSKWNLGAMRLLSSLYSKKEHQDVSTDRPGSIPDTIGMAKRAAGESATIDGSNDENRDLGQGGDAEPGDNLGDRSANGRIERLGATVEAASNITNAEISKMSAANLKKRIDVIMSKVVSTEANVKGTNLKEITVTSEVSESDRQSLLGYDGAGGSKEKNRTPIDVMSAYFTPQKIVSKMWDLAKQYISPGAEVLEPSGGNGRFVDPAFNFDLIEFNPKTAKMAAAVNSSNPNCKIMQGAFQELFLKQGRVVQKNYTGKKYDLVIGNPPYGELSGQYKGLGEGADSRSYEQYFIDRGLDTLKDGGIMAYIVPSGFMRGSQNKEIKEKIAAKGKILEAYRLPAGVFKNTGVNTDILIIQKTPGNVEDFSDKYFERNPQAILGEESERTNQFGKMTYYVSGDISAIDKIVPRGPMPEATKEKISIALQGNQNAKKFDKVAYAAFYDGLTGKAQELFDKLLDETSDVPAAIKDAFMRPDIVRKMVETANDIGALSSDVYAAADRQLNTYPSGKKSTKKQSTEQEKTQTKKEIIKKKPKEGDIVAQYAVVQPDAPRYTAEEFNAKFAPQHSTNSVEIWSKTNWDGIIDPEYAKAHFDAKQMSYHEGNVVHDINYASGNISEKIKNLKKGQIAFIKQYGEDQYQKQLSLLSDAMPKMRDVKTLDISINSRLVKDFKFDINHEAPFEKIVKGEFVEVPNAIPVNFREGTPMFAVDNKDGTWSMFDAQYGLSFETRPASSVEEFSQLVESLMGDSSYNYEERRARYIDQKNIPRTAKYENAKSVKTMFSEWAGVGYRGTYEGAVTASMLEGLSWSQIEDYIDGKAVKGYQKDPQKKQQVKEKRRRIAEELFLKFLREGLSPEHEKQFGSAYNETFNSHVDPDYSKIPIKLDGFGHTYGGKVYKPHKHQLEAVAFLVNKGSGLLAHDVGLGKTSEGIMATVYNMQLGRCKKPAFIVPKQVYQKFVRTVRQHFPDIKINAIDNLSKYGSDNMPIIDENSITIMSETALQKISFKDDTIQDMTRDMSDVMADLSPKENVKAPTERQAAMKQQKLEEAAGKGAKVKGDDVIFFEDLGIDHITVDEAHHYRKVFTTPRLNKGRSAADTNEFGGIGGGKPADRAGKMFAMSQYIQKKNNGRNVFMLTATPFQNSPIEIYNMLSMLARERLKKLGIFNLKEFMSAFCKIEDEWVITAGEIKKKSVVKEFNNLSALQGLIREYIDFKTGDDTTENGERLVKRPKKNTEAVSLKMNEMQESIMALEEENYLNYDPINDPGGILKALNNMRAATLSPKLHPKYRNDKSVDFVKSSPKLTFVANTVAKAYKDNPNIGQVVYLPEGIEFHADFAAHLAKELGVDKDAIAIISGAPKDSVTGKAGKKWHTHITDTTSDAFVNVNKEFNSPGGRIKIIIGSGKISEGVSLNGNSSTIYNCMLGWNPTETVQVDGRIHRQGNIQEQTNHIIPLIADSIDSVMYQKHDEKSSRLANVWSYNESESMSIGDIQPGDMKYDLIRDPEKRTNFRIGIEQEELDRRIEMEKGFKEEVRQKLSVIGTYSEEIPRYRKRISELKSEITEKTNEAESIKAENPKEYKEMWSYRHARDSIGYLKADLRSEESEHKKAMQKLDLAEVSIKRLGITPETQESFIEGIDAKIEGLNNLKKELSENRASILSEEIEKNRNKPKLDDPLLAAEKMAKKIESRATKISTLEKADRIVYKAKGFVTDEAKWEKAKKIAAKEGKGEDYAYITGIYKKMMGLSKAEKMASVLLPDGKPGIILSTSEYVRVLTVGANGQPRIQRHDDSVSLEPVDSGSIPQDLAWYYRALVALKNPALEKAGKIGLVPKQIMVTRDGKIFPQTVWVKAADDRAKTDNLPSPEAYKAISEGDIGAMATYFQSLVWHQDGSLSRNARAAMAGIDENDGEDAAQEAILLIMKKMSDKTLTAKREELPRLVFGILKWRAKDVRVQQGRFEQLEDKGNIASSQESHETKSDRISDFKSIADRINASLGNPIQKNVFASYLSGKSHKEIATQYGVSVPLVKKIINKIAPSIREQMASLGYTSKRDPAKVFRDQYRLEIGEYKAAAQRPGKTYMDFQGLSICVENPTGSIRSGKDKNGEIWQTIMDYPYGYIMGIPGDDGEELDAFVGPSPQSETAFIVSIKHPETGKYDEKKVFLGFDSEEDAMQAFHEHYDMPDYVHGVESKPVSTLKQAASKKVAIKKADKLPGGKGDDRPDSDFDPEQLAIGTKVESEHTDDKSLAKEIAKDHLTEDKDYYKKLATIEQDVPMAKAKRAEIGETRTRSRGTYKKIGPNQWVPVRNPKPGGETTEPDKKKSKKINVKKDGKKTSVSKESLKSVLKNTMKGLVDWLAAAHQGGQEHGPVTGATEKTGQDIREAGNKKKEEANQDKRLKKVKVKEPTKGNI